MNDFEKVVQKNIITLVKYLPTHVTTWSTILDDILRPLQVLSNQSEQLRCVDSAKIDWMENFKQIQGSLSHKISRELSDTLIELKLKINQLKQVNNDLKTKVLTLEQSSLAIDWNSSSRIVKGSPTQPSLENLLDHCLSFLTFFLEIGEKIYNAFSNLELENNQCEIFERRFHNIVAIIGIIILFIIEIFWTRRIHNITTKMLPTL